MVDGKRRAYDFKASAGLAENSEAWRWMSVPPGKRQIQTQQRLRISEGLPDYELFSRV
jgi:hypothetical protein